MMTINEVKKKTGLTKKAINYYELKGLINPKYHPTNRYRDFSEPDLKEKEVPLPQSMPEISQEMIEVMKMIAKLKKFVVEELQVYLTPMAEHLEILSPSYTKTKENLAKMYDLMSSSEAHQPLLEKYAQIKEKVNEERG